jgi:hypothetical protein
MDNNFRFILEKKGRKHHCPECGKPSFVRYIDTETGQLLPEKYGRCDREVKCAYHINPYKDNFATPTPGSFAPMDKPLKKFIPTEVLKATLKGYEENCFVRNLRYNVPFPFEVKDLENVIAQYFLGTILEGDRSGAITFPFIDINGKVCAIQVKEFDLMNHTTGTDFLHSIIKRYHEMNNSPFPDWLSDYLKNEKMVTCFFGDHLLKKYPYNPIALVEAPKSAIYGTLYFGFPDDPRNLLWMAVYNLSSLTYEKCQSLKGRHVYLFPDLSKDGKAFGLWTRKTRELSERMPGTFFKVSDLLEKEANPSERLKGSDIADFLIKQDWRKFRSQPPKGEKSENSERLNNSFFSQEKDQETGSTTQKRHQDPCQKVVTMADPIIKKGIWSDEIQDLEQFFKSVKLPTEPVKLNQCEMITDIPLFIKSHLGIVNGQNGNLRYVSYLERLHELKKILSN